MHCVRLYQWSETQDENGCASESFGPESVDCERAVHATANATTTAICPKIFMLYFQLC